MELLEIKRVKVGDRDYPIKITARAMIEYEKLSGKSIAEYEGTENLFQFFYVTAKAGAKSEGIKFEYTYDQFLDAIDDYYTEAVTNFSMAIFEPGEENKKKQGQKSSR